MAWIERAEKLAVSIPGITLYVKAISWFVGVRFFSRSMWGLVLDWPYKCGGGGTLGKVIATNALRMYQLEYRHAYFLGGGPFACYLGFLKLTLSISYRYYGFFFFPLDLLCLILELVVSLPPDWALGWPFFFHLFWWGLHWLNWSGNGRGSSFGILRWC